MDKEKWQNMHTLKQIKLKPKVCSVAKLLDLTSSGKSSSAQMICSPSKQSVPLRCFVCFMRAHLSCLRLFGKMEFGSNFQFYFSKIAQFCICTGFSDTQDPTMPESDSSPVKKISEEHLVAALYLFTPANNRAGRSVSMVGVGYRADNRTRQATHLQNTSLI